MKAILIMVLLLCGMQALSDTQDDRSRKSGVLCILYFSAYSCSACREAFVEYIGRYGEANPVSYRIAIGFQREKEFRAFLKKQRNPEIYIQANAGFLAKHPGVRDGDIIIVGDARETRRINLFKETWKHELEQALQRPARTYSVPPSSLRKRFNN